MKTQLNAGPLKLTAEGDHFLRVDFDEDRINYLDRDEIIDVIAFLSAALANPEYTAI